jgi:actin-like ATPase involved in cell morphogenesis
MGYELGIDLGTTFTAAAVHRDGRVRIFDLGDRAPSIPSVVFLREDGEILTGDAANRRALDDPSRVARGFKRRIGDPVPALVAGTPYPAEMLTAQLLHWVVARVVAEERGSPDRVVVTHPANWGPFKLDLLGQAVRHADLDVRAVSYLSEPQAAAIFYSSQAPVAPGQVVAVYDLGGGTFDAAVVRRGTDGFTLLGEPEGSNFGGLDIDEAVWSHVNMTLGDRLAGLDPEAPGNQLGVAQLRQECVAAKEHLSTDNEARIPVLLSGIQTSVRLTRGELETMMRPLLAETMTALRRAIRGAGVTPEQISAVLLIGGSSRIPLVGQLVGEAIGRPVAVDAHPKHAVALGAAIAAAGQHDAGNIRSEVATAEPPVSAAVSLIEPGAVRDTTRPSIPEPTGPPTRIPAAVDLRPAPPLTALGSETIDLRATEPPAQAPASPLAVSAARPDRKRLALALAAVAVVSAVILATELWPRPASRFRAVNGCPTLNTPVGFATDDSDERVGITDGTSACALSFHDPNDGVRQAEFEAQGLIDTANAGAAQADPAPSVIVFFGPLQETLAAKSVLGRLRGLTVAVQQANDGQLVDGGLLGDHKVQLLLADPGRKFGHWQQTTDQIVALAKKRRIVGVVGITQSREESKAAIRKLIEAGLPVIAEAVTGVSMASSFDDAGGKGLYAQVSPTNDRIAEELVKFATHDVTDTNAQHNDSPLLPHVRRGVLVKDCSDAFSEDMSAQVVARMSDKQILLTVNHKLDPTKACVNPQPQDDRHKDVDKIENAVADICSTVQPGDAVFFNSRADDLILLDKMHQTCPKSLVIVAGPVLTSLSASPKGTDDLGKPIGFDPAADLCDPFAKRQPCDGYQLYYATYASRNFADAKVDAGGSPANLVAKSFLSAYDSIPGTAVATPTDIGEAADAYDSVKALTTALAGAIHAHGDQPVTAGDVDDVLRAGITFDGVTGKITLSGNSPVSPNRPVIVMQMKPTSAAHPPLVDVAPVFGCGEFEFGVEGANPNFGQVVDC